MTDRPFPLIPPEIINDDFYNHLRWAAGTGDLGTILEIGSSSGDGSTLALASGIAINPRRPRLFCMEIIKERYDQLAARYAGNPQVVTYNTSSVRLRDLASADEVRRFCASGQTILSRLPIDTVLGWLEDDRAYMTRNGIDEAGIERIKRDHGIDCFDMVLIDGSEFTGKAELNAVYGARVIALDDICAFKNFENHQRLLADPAYELVIMNRLLRNGYSIFLRRG